MKTTKTKKRGKSVKKTASDYCFFIPVDAYVEGYGFRVSLVKRDEPGHCPTGTWPYEGKLGQTMPYFWGDTFEKACETADRMNERLGLTKADAALIVLSSMFPSRGARVGDQE